MKSDLPNDSQRFFEVAADGSLSVPRDLAQRMGLVPGARIPVKQYDEELVLGLPSSHLARVYIEPTNSCPLSCKTCMRRTWSEPVGFMEDATFDRIERGLAELSVLPSVFLGGFGEPLSHPKILDMVWRLKLRGATVELITNGIALDESIARQLVDAGLNTLWVSMDGATPECYGEVRNSPDFSRIVENLRGLKMLKWHRDATKPELGIAFVAMKKNKAELMEVMNLGLRLGATRLSVSNVQPYTEEMRSELLFERSLDEHIRLFSRLDLPRMDLGGAWNPDVMDLVARYGLRLAGEGASSRSFDACPFLQKGSLSVRWDGEVSPCLPLLHTHSTWLGPRKRLIREHSFGSVRDRSLREIWEDPGYVAFRRRLQEFYFPPCIRCNSCDWIDTNQEDCLSGEPPACGGCLWAQGYILCP